MKSKIKSILYLIKKSSKTCKGMFILALFLIAVGVVNLLYPYIGMEDIISFISYIYFIFSALTFICYFYSREEKDYEFLLLAVTSVIIGCFFYLVDDINVGILLGTGILSFGLQAIAIRTYRIVYFYRKNNYLWLSKLTTTILLGLTTILISINLFTGTTEVQTMLFGFYFIVYGIIYLLDLLLGTLVKTKKFENFIHS